MDNSALVSATFWLSWLDPIKFWAEVGVAICLSVGVIAAFFASPLAKRVEHARLLQIAQLENATAEAKRDAEQERLARVKIEEKSRRGDLLRLARIALRPS